ncbi:MAG: hypothetical protein JWR80_8027 [Bradyrhizobium sp.]|nr:hypothetical protein [Bradyrhizobium sp.]
MTAMNRAQNTEKFAEKISDSAILFISFDVFDTLICRPTRKPDHMYVAVGDEAAASTGMTGNEFSRLRRRAENDVRVNARFAGEEEVTLTQIYERFCAICGLGDIVAELTEIEERVELENFYLSPFGKKMISEARNLKKKILFLSDTYFSDAFMRKALTVSGLMEEGDELIVSSSHKLTKHTGNLYRLLLSNRRRENVLHVGDNVGSDIRNALKVGLNVFHVSSGNELARRKKYLLTDQGSDPSLSLAQGAINKLLLSDQGDDGFQGRISRIGYKTLGPFWLGFCEFIRQECERGNVEKLFFLARDGFVLRKAYKAYSGIDAEYLCVSRRTLYLAFAHVDFESAFPLLLQNYSEATVSAVLSRLLPDGVKIEDINLPKWAGEFLDEEVSSGHVHSALIRIARVLTPLIRKNAADHFEAIGAYFRHVGIDQLSRIGIVDIGWHGSMQVLLQKILQEMDYRIKITGIYAGLYEHAKKPVSNDTMTAYLFDYGQNKEIERQVQCGPSVLEVLHSAPHGTTVGYSIEPSGAVVPVFANSPAEVDQYGRFVQHWHKGGLQFISDFLEAKEKLAKDAEIPIDLTFAKNLLRMIERPSPEESSFISILGLHPDFGQNDEMIRLMEQRGNGEKSMWPIGRSMKYRDRLPEWFDEDRYLDARPDVLAAVQAGMFECGYDHYVKHGRSEGR